MKSLYNIAGILPAQCRANPNDCGIAWSEHRKVERVKRDDTVKIAWPEISFAWPEISFQRRIISDEAPLLQVDPSPLDEYIKETMAACMSKLMIMPKLMIDVNPADQGADQTVTTAFTLKPIDPQTIKVGDTVRLVGSRTITEWTNSNIDVGKDYKVIYVDKDCNEGMSISVSYSSFGGFFWIYDEDIVLVESA